MPYTGNGDRLKTPDITKHALRLAGKEIVGSEDINEALLSVVRSHLRESGEVMFSANCITHNALRKLFEHLRPEFGENFRINLTNPFGMAVLTAGRAK